jgi:hypothetical protein
VSDVTIARGEGGMRAEQELMTPERLGALPPTLLSFSRSLVRRMIGQGWTIERRVMEIDAEGRGDAVYRVTAEGRIFEFVIFSFEAADPTVRTDRIIGHKWDTMAALLEGEATPERIEATRRELPKLYSGRAVDGTLVWCRSNRSLRLFEHVVSSLATGRQPDVERLADVCYIMRNTGLDANGTFGTRSFLAYGDDHPVASPYHAQMLAAYLSREFGADLAEHLASRRAPGAARLDPSVRRFIGLGNSSGLGLVLFANNHPALLGRWLELRETCLAHARDARLAPDAPQVVRLQRLLRACIRFREQDRIEYGNFASSATVAQDLRVAAELLDEFRAEGTVGGVPTETPGAALSEALAERVHPESLEQLHGLLIDSDPAFVDEVNARHVTSEVIDVVPDATVGELRELLARDYGWCFDVDMEAEGARRYFWYKSIEAEEPRRGIRDGDVPGFDLAVDVPGEVQRLDEALAAYPASTTVGAFLALRPAHRAFVRRVHGLRDLRYHTPRMNTLGEEFVPAHIIRLLNSSIYGLDKTRDVKFSHNRWVRGVMFHGAPTASEVSSGAAQEWTYPEEPVT